MIAMHDRAGEAHQEHEHLLDDVQRRLDANPQATRKRRETVEHPFGTIKAHMGATHFLMKTLPKVAAEIARLYLVLRMSAIPPLLEDRRTYDAAFGSVSITEGL